VRGLHPVVKEWLRARYGDSQTGGWVNEKTGLIRTRRDFDEFPWPEPQDLGGYNDHTSLDEYLQAMRRCLPPAMKLIVQLGYLFMGAWQIMGFENFLRPAGRRSGVRASRRRPAGLQPARGIGDSLAA